MLLDTALLILLWFWLQGQILWHESSVKKVLPELKGQAKLQLETSQGDTEMVSVTVCPSLWSTGEDKEERLGQGVPCPTLLPEECWSQTKSFRRSSPPSHKSDKQCTLIQKPDLLLAQKNLTKKSLTPHR